MSRANFWLGRRGTAGQVAFFVGPTWLNWIMSNLYTKNGCPLRLQGGRLYSRSGVYVGNVHDGRVYDPSGRYAETIVGDRVVYRSTHSARIKGPSTSANRAAMAAANRAQSALWGEEPRFPD